ncbi:hypothetical protein WJX82_002870 [Trebouxia sp. C0006]
MGYSTQGSGHACDITSVQLKREDMLKMKCTQLERQVNMLQAALQSRSQLTAEVENILSELTHSLILLAKKTAEHPQKPKEAATDLMAYSQQMLSRLSRLKRQTSLSQARSAVHSAGPDQPFCSDGSTHCQLPFFSAPGSFLEQPSNNISVTDLCQGRGVLLANQTRTQQLESELAGLAPKLSSLTVLLWTTVLPAISLVNPEAATRLQVEVAETAEATAQAANALTPLSVLLPSQGLLFGKAACHTVCQGAAVKVAGQESGVWSGSAAASPSQDQGKGATACTVPSAKQLLAQLPAFAVRDRPAAIQVLSDLLDRLKMHQGMQQQNMLSLEKELHYLRSLHASQAQHVGRIFSVADAALTELEPTTAVATVAAADALRKVLQAQEQLTNHCSEASLTQLIAVVRDTSPELQRACWLLVTQQETYKSQVKEALNAVKMNTMNAWQAANTVAVALATRGVHTDRVSGVIGPCALALYALNYSRIPFMTALTALFGYNLSEQLPGPYYVWALSLAAALYYNYGSYWFTAGVSLLALWKFFKKGGVVNALTSLATVGVSAYVAYHDATNLWVMILVSAQIAWSGIRTLLGGSGIA